MNINLNMRDIRRMNTYLSNSQIADLIDCMVNYVDNCTDYDFYNDKMQMLWDDIKPQLDKSIKSYSEWLKKQREAEFDNAMKEIMLGDK